jgi:hypothetical protein
MLELRRDGRVFNQPEGPIGLLDIGYNKLALIGLCKLDEFRFARLRDLEHQQPPRDPGWDDTSCVVDPDGVPIASAPLDISIHRSASASGEVIVIDGDVFVTEPARFSSVPFEDPDIDEEIEAQRQRLGLGPE